MESKFLRNVAITGFSIAICSVALTALKKDNNKIGKIISNIRIDEEIEKNLIHSEENGTMFYPFGKNESKKQIKRRYIKLK